MKSEVSGNPWIRGDDTAPLPWLQEEESLITSSCFPKNAYQFNTLSELLAFVTRALVYFRYPEHILRATKRKLPLSELSSFRRRGKHGEPVSIP